MDDVEQARGREEEPRIAMLAFDVDAISASIDDRLAYTRVWSKWSDEWRVIAGHAGAIP